MVCAKMRDRGISTQNARRIRMGIAAGEVIYNFVVKEDRVAAIQALVKASLAPKRTYIAAIHTLAKRMGCEPEQIML